MTMTRIFAAGVGGLALAVLASGTTATAQVAPLYGGPHQYAADRCVTAVQYRLSHRTGVRGFGGQVVGGRVVEVTRSDPRREYVRVTGLAISDRYAYGQYGTGAYGALGYKYSQTADMSFHCNVDYGGRVLKVDINKR